MGHSERAHALLSASSAHRWLACTPSARLEEQFPDTTSEAAREGTLAHELAELKLQHYFNTTEFGRQKFSRRVNKLKKEELWQEEMDGYTEEYLDYVKQEALRQKCPVKALIEQRVYFKEYTFAETEDDIDGSGIADCILLYGDTVQVIDFKYGKGVPVSAERNPQLLLYALGACCMYRFLYPIRNIKIAIVQPRLNNISEWECTLEELFAFGEQVREKAALAVEGEGEYCPSESVCRFCRARAKCRARAEENVKLAFFTNKKPPLISNEEVGRYLLQGEDIDRWLKDLKEYALAECLAGKEVPGWKAVEGRGNRDWADMDAAFEKLQASGIPEALLWERKPLTLAQVEKTVGKKEFASCVGDMVVKNPGKPALAKESDKREAITNKVSAAEAFREDTREHAEENHIKGE